MPIEVIEASRSAAEWEATGRRLQRLDPRAFERVLELAQRIVRIHEDPIAVMAGDAVHPDELSVDA